MKKNKVILILIFCLCLFSCIENSSKNSVLEKTTFHDKNLPKEDSIIEPEYETLSDLDNSFIDSFFHINSKNLRNKRCRVSRDVLDRNQIKYTISFSESDSLSVLVDPDNSTIQYNYNKKNLKKISLNNFPKEFIFDINYQYSSLFFEQNNIVIISKGTRWTGRMTNTSIIQVLDIDNNTISTIWANPQNTPSEYE